MNRNRKAPLQLARPTRPMTLPLTYAMKRAVVANKGGLVYAAMKGNGK